MFSTQSASFLMQRCKSVAAIKWQYCLSIVVALSFGFLLVLESPSAIAQDQIRPVPKASCGPLDRTESVQGETTLAERFAPGPAKAYNCNLELVGQFEGEGAADGFDAYKDCAYFSIAQGAQTQHPGVAVIDASDARHPKPTAYLNSPAMLAAFESVRVDQRSKLLIASKMSTTDPTPFDLYDLSADCRHPVFKSSVAFPGVYAHSGTFAPDGRTYYAAKWPSDAKASVFAVDVSDPSTPSLLAMWLPPTLNWITHSATVSQDGSRVYVSPKRMTSDQETSVNPNGLVILDASDIQARKPRAQFRLISSLFWNDSHGAEGMMPVKVHGRAYLVFSDNLGSIGYTSPVPANACDSGNPGEGFARIIDISDEKHPKTASRLILEAAEPSNCSKVMHDPTMYGGYGSFACSVDDDENGELLACADFEAGLRVFDIRDPAHPRELAYYKPPARRTESRNGSQYYELTSPPQDHTTDSVIDINGPIFRNHGHEIWFTSVDNGFQVVRFSDRFVAAHPDLFH